MPIRHAIWKIGTTPEPLATSSLANEQLLEDMIVAAPTILSEQLFLIGRQEITSHGGRIDLLAIEPDGSLVLIELKRNKTPREVIAQALDYGSWVKKLQAEDIAGIFQRFATGKDLATEFGNRFGVPLDEETLNESHRIVVVASSLDDSSERIVEYLSDYDIPINVLFFQVFKNGSEQFISRTWLLDPVHSEASPAAVPAGAAEPWNGEYYVSYGPETSRSWDEAVKYGFVSAGGGAWYSSKLGILNPGDRIWVKSPEHGFVGVGRVTGTIQPANEFRVMTEKGEVPVLDVVSGGHYHRQYVDDPEMGAVARLVGI